MADIPVGFFSPEQAKLTWETIKEIRTSGLLKNAKPGAIVDDPGIHQVRVVNESGEEVPEFACMQIIDTLVDNGITYLRITKPTATDGKYIFNNASRIAIDEMGIGHTWDVVRMLGSGAAVPLAGYGATIGAWTIQQQDGGPFTVYGEDALSGVYKGRIETQVSGVGSVIEFEIIASSASTQARDLCSERLYDAPTFVTARVISRPCGVAHVEQEVNGTVVVHDRGGKFLFEREAVDLDGKIGFATLMGASEDSSASSSVEPCQWVITWIDWFRWVQMMKSWTIVNDTVVIEYKNVKVWDDCDLPDDIIQGTDCIPPTSSSSSL